MQYRFFTFLFSLETEEKLQFLFYSLDFICMDGHFCFFFCLQMNTGEIQYLPTSDGLISSKLGFRLQLQSLHFGGPVPSPGNSLTLRCTAHIGNLYQEYSEIELGVPQRDPIPARGECLNEN